MIVGIGGAQDGAAGGGLVGIGPGDRKHHALVLGRRHDHRVRDRQARGIEDHMRPLGRTQQRRWLVALQQSQHQVGPRPGGVDGDLGADLHGLLGVDDALDGDAADQALVAFGLAFDKAGDAGVRQDLRAVALGVQDVLNRQARVVGDAVVVGNAAGKTLVAETGLFGQQGFFAVGAMTTGGREPRQRVVHQQAGV